MADLYKHYIIPCLFKSVMGECIIKWKRALEPTMNNPDLWICSGTVFSAPKKNMIVNKLYDVVVFGNVPFAYMQWCAV